jgi:hypothetical protein
MRSLLILSETLQIPSSIKLLFKNKRCKNGVIVLYDDDRIDLKIFDQGETLIITDGIVSNLDAPIIDENFFLKNCHLDGQFTVFNIGNSGIKLATDFINVHRFAYGFLENKLIICENLDIILDLIQYNDPAPTKNPTKYVDSQALIQSLSYHYSTFNNRTLIKEVRYFSSGSVIEIENNKVNILGVDNIDRNKAHAVSIDFDNLLEKNAALIKRDFDKIIFPVSGGVDSRLTLYSFFELLKLVNKSSSVLVTHGESNDIEVRLAKQISCILDVKHTSVSIRNLYGSCSEINLVLKSGWNWILGKWIPVLNDLQGRKTDKNTLLVFGSTFDIFRAKYVKSIRSRKQRIWIQMGLNPLDNNMTIEVLEHNYEEKIISDLTRTYRNYIELFRYLDVNLENLIDEFRSDFRNTSKSVKKLFQPTNIHEFEEGLNFMTWGKGAMASQARLLNQFYPCYVLDANRLLIKQVLLIPYKKRFEDKLVHRLLKNSKLSVLGTSQIPFVPYSYPIIIKYLFWAFRSSIDQHYMKIARKLRFKKNRLFTAENWQTVYSERTNLENFHSYFEGLESLMSYPLNYYDNRASGKSRALSEIDLTNAAQIALILKKMGVKQ